MEVIFDKTWILNDMIFLVHIIPPENPLILWPDEKMQEILGREYPRMHALYEARGLDDDYFTMRIDHEGEQFARGACTPESFFVSYTNRYYRDKAIRRSCFAICHRIM